MIVYFSHNHVPIIYALEQILHSYQLIIWARLSTLFQSTYSMNLVGPINFLYLCLSSSHFIPLDSVLKIFYLN
jgi:hypothetical protein